MPKPPIAKVTAKNQLTLPKAVMEALGNPTHFRIMVAQGNLVLFPATLATYDEQAKEAGIPPEVLRRAHAMVEAERAAKRKARKG